MRFVQRRARIFCLADQASLCWDCDAKVHSANFLVARHSRKLLCRVCQGPTPWSATGAKLVPTASACELCFDRETRAAEEVVVVPRSPPPPECSSSMEEAASGGEAVVLGKRIRAASSNDEDESSSSSPAEVSSLHGRVTRLSQKIRRMGSGPGRVDACGSSDLDPMRKFQRDEPGSGRAEFYTFL